MHWEWRISSGKVWWLDNSRSQSSWWWLWISKQSPVCSRGARSGYSMVAIISVQNQNSSGNRKDFTKVPRAVTQTKSHLHRQFIGIWKILWRDLSWNHRTSALHRSETNAIAERGSTGKRSSIGTLRFGWKMWSGSMECYCCLRNVQDLLADGKTLSMKDDLENHSKGQ